MAASWTVAPLPPEAVAAVRAEVGSLVDEVVGAVVADSPVYGAVLSSPEGMAIRMGIEQAVGAFLDAVERGERPGSGTAELWRRLGEVEFQSGRGLDALRAAFRTGTRAVWRGAAELAAAAGIPTPQVIGLAEAIFVFSDELAAEVVEGYLRMQSDEAGELERRRRRLVSLLLDEEGFDSEAVARAAALARWRVPRSLAALAVSGHEPGPIGRRLSVDALVGADADGAFLLVPDPEGPGRRDELARGVGDSEAIAVGPTVGVREAARSLRWARLALGLAARGALAGAARGPVRVEEHLADMILLQDEALAGALVEARLAPVIGLPDHDRERLLETLEAWLAHQRHTPGVAAALHVHPQTVRYRLGKLRELLGEALDDPDARLELELALRARRAASNATGAGGV
jgi:hypothetical protein